MNNTLHILYGLFEKIDENHEKMHQGWKNLKLAKETFSVIKELPLRIEGELTPYALICFIDYTLTNTHLEDVPRFALEAYRYALPLFDEIREDDLQLELLQDYHISRDDVQKKIRYLEDYIDPQLSTEDFCSRYGKDMKFDPVERTEKWEEVIYSVEKACAEQLSGEYHGMGFCHIYWTTKAAILAEYGIQWKSPSACNPTYLFD